MACSRMNLSHPQTLNHTSKLHRVMAYRILPPLTAARKAEFESLIIKKPGDACWEWIGFKTPDGYGKFGVGRGNQYYTHRFAWLFHTGTDPGDMQVCHTCDNPACCRPDHLFLGTQTDNMKDMTAKGRRSTAQLKDRRGERSGMAKFKDEQVIEMRTLRSNGGVTVKALAKRFNCHPRTVVLITGRHTWKHIP